VFEIKKIDETMRLPRRPLVSPSPADALAVTTANVVASEAKQSHYDQEIATPPAVARDDSNKEK